MKVAIIGGAGKMGQWFAARLLQGGSSGCNNRAKSGEIKSGREKAESADFDEYGSGQTGRRCHHLRAAGTFEPVGQGNRALRADGQMFFDVTSLKRRSRWKSCTAISTKEPFWAPIRFRAGAKSAANQNFVLTPTMEAEAVLAAKNPQVP